MEIPAGQQNGTRQHCEELLLLPFLAAIVTDCSVSCSGGLTLFAANEDEEIVPVLFFFDLSCDRDMH